MLPFAQVVWVWRWLVGLLTALALGCEARPATPKQPLRVGLLMWPPYELAVLARERKYFPPELIRLLDYRSPAEVMRAYGSRAVDVIAVTTHYVVQLEATSPGNAIVFVANISRGGDAVLARQPGSLAEKRIGVEASPLGLYVLDCALAAEGLSRDDVTLVPVDIPYHRQAFRGGTVDAVVTYEPVRSKLLAAGAVEVFNSTSIPNEIVDVLLVRDETLDRRERELRWFVDGWLRAREDFLAEPAAAAAIVAPREGLTPEAFIVAMRGAELPDRGHNHRLLSSDLGPGLESVITHSLETGLIDHRVAVDDVLDASLVLSP